jgi:hypothetical protein
MKIRMLKVPKLSFGIAFQDALLEVRYLAKSVHVQLTNERREIAMFEKSWEDIICKALLLIDYGWISVCERVREEGEVRRTKKRVPGIGPSYEFVSTWRIYQPRRGGR